MKKIISLFCLCAILFACNNDSGDANAITGTWQAKKMESKGRVINSNEKEAFIDTVVRETKQNKLNDGEEFTAEDSLREVEEATGIFNSIFNIKYDFKSDKSFSLSYIREGETNEETENGKYEYDGPAQQMTFVFDSASKVEVKEKKVKVDLRQDTLIIVNDDNSRFTFERIKK